jgi:hypothetical protein
VTPQTPAEEKRLSTLMARAALAGIVVHGLENDHGQPVYIVSHWALTRELDSLDELQEWLERVTGDAHAV